MESPEIQKIREWLGSGAINVFGRPFSGKDTQAKKLSELFGASVIGGGDIIRSSGQQEMKDHIGTGRLTPQDQYLKLVLPYLSKKEYHNKPLILSSLGRWHGEEKPVTQAATDAKHPIMAAIYLDVPETIVLNRWEAARKIGDRGDRNDDNDTSIKKRLEEFRNKTIPVLDYYRQAGLLVEIDGTHDRDTVTNKILQMLQARD